MLQEKELFTSYNHDMMLRKGMRLRDKNKFLWSFFQIYSDDDAKSNKKIRFRFALLDIKKNMYRINFFLKNISFFFSYSILIFCGFKLKFNRFQIFSGTLKDDRDE